MRPLLLPLILMILALATPSALAASFDCSKAATPFETAICNDPALSASDTMMAKAFATAIGGLEKPAAAAMRDDQRAWLAYANRDCTDDAQPLTSGTYSSQQRDCLNGLFQSRIKTLEGSRMIGGIRFYLQSTYAALRDTSNTDADYSWKVASYDASAPRIDGQDDLARAFNGFIDTKSAALSPLLGAHPDASGLDETSDTSVEILVDQVLPGRISLTSSSYYFGHGAAHGNTGLGNMHYLVPQGRELLASDIFKGEAWQQKLLVLVKAQLVAHLGENLMLDDASSIAGVIADPDRWRFGDNGLTIQFQQYEVASYADGVPDVEISWAALAEDLTDDYTTVLFGY